MERIKAHFLASHLQNGTLRFDDEEVAKDFAGPKGTVTPIEESFIFQTIPEYALFKEDNKYFFEDAKKLKLSGVLTKRGSELLQQLIAKTSKEKVALLLHQPMTQFTMEPRLINRLTQLKLFSLLDIIKIKSKEDLMKRNRLGPVLGPKVIAILESKELEFDMVTPFNE